MRPSAPMAPANTTMLRACAPVNVRVARTRCLWCCAREVVVVALERAGAHRSCCIDITAAMKNVLSPAHHHRTLSNHHHNTPRGHAAPISVAAIIATEFTNAAQKPVPFVGDCATLPSGRACKKRTHAHAHMHPQKYTHSHTQTARMRDNDNTHANNVEQTNYKQTHVHKQTHSTKLTHV